MNNNLMDNPETLRQFEALRDAPAQVMLSDAGDGDWTQNWFLDGKRASVTNLPDGMVFSAGLIERDQASHAVLWTKQSFSGDIKIEFDYTRLDTIDRYVNILYIHATGHGDGPYAKDITQWNHLRQIPYMRTYYNHLNALHISYAAFPKDEPDYVRMRRYPTSSDRPFNQLEVGPDYRDTGLFEAGAAHHFTVIKKGHDTFMQITADAGTRLFHWNTSAFDDLTHGHFGIRHMWTRCAQYGNIRISQLQG